MLDVAPRMRQDFGDDTSALTLLDAIPRGKGATLMKAGFEMDLRNKCMKES